MGDGDLEVPSVQWERSGRRILSSRISIPRVQSVLQCDKCGNIVRKNSFHEAWSGETRRNMQDYKKLRKGRPISLNLDQKYSPQPYVNMVSLVNKINHQIFLHASSITLII